MKIGGSSSINFFENYEISDSHSSMRHIPQPKKSKKQKKKSNTNNTNNKNNGYTHNNNNNRNGGGIFDVSRSSYENFEDFIEKIDEEEYCEEEEGNFEHEYELGIDDSDVQDESSVAGTGAGNGSKRKMSRSRVFLTRTNEAFSTKIRFTPKDMEQIVDNYETIAKSKKNIIVKTKIRGLDVAMKIIEKRGMYIKECKVLLRVYNHPNVVRVYGYYTRKINNKQRYCIVMELFPSTLLDYIKQEINFKNKIKIILEISKGMKYIHSKRIVFGDLKMDNVMINELNIAKIIDFDSSIFLKDLIESKNYPVIGSTYYCSPEIYNRKDKYSRSTDVYSFAILVLEIIVGDKISNFCPKYNYTKASNDPKYRPKFPEKFKLKKGQNWIIDLMKDCWNHDPNKRPSFEEIVEIVEEHYLDLIEFKELETDFLVTSNEKKQLVDKKNENDH